MRLRVVVVVLQHANRILAEGFVMGWKSRTVRAVIVILLLAGISSQTSLATGNGDTSSQAQPGTVHPPTGVGSCTLKNWNPNLDPEDAKDLPEGARLQTYKPDDYDCTGAVFAADGVEFAQFPQPNNFLVTNQHTSQPMAATQAAATTNPLAPYFPPFTHFVIVYRENHTFDDYLGDCATTIQAGCNGVVQGTNHISSVPNLHTLAKTYALLDAYSTGTQPPSGPNHWWLFSGQSSSSSQQQSYPAATGTEFDRFLKGPSGGYTFIMDGDFYWMLNTGSGYWRNPATNAIEVLPVNRPGTSIPEEIDYNHYTCCGQNDDDQTIANDYLNFVSANGLPAYSYIELFNDHPGTFQDLPKNDNVSKQIVDAIMGNAAYKDNTLIVVTEDDTQNGNNGPDHVSNTYRVPTVIIASPTYMKQAYISHVAYRTDNILAAMERVMNNVHPGVIDPNNNIGLATFPMTTADQSGLGDPLEDIWIQGATPLSATASGAPTTGNAPLAVSFTGSATGGTAPYSFSWNFGDGSTSTAQNPSHTYNSACSCTATLTVTDSSSPAKTATSTVAISVSAVGNPLAATASAAPTSGQVPLNIAFTGTATGGTPPYSFSWNFGDGSATSTVQNPSHTYNSAGTFTATLTVSDSSAPVKTATSSVTITASPISGTPPGAPTGLSASAGNAQISLSWAAPASNGGVTITSYRVYRGTSSGTETLLTSGGCSGLGPGLSCTDTGLTSGQAYFYKVSAVNAIGEGAQSNEASATPVANPLSQNFDGSNSIPAGWTATGLWRVGSDCMGVASAPNSLQFNRPSPTCDYNPSSGRTSGFATSPTFDISTASAPTLTFNTKYQVESYSGHTDQMKVQAKTATGSWTTLWSRDSTNPAQTTFVGVTLDLSSYKSSGTQIRFSFDSMDTYPRSHPGWAVDDVFVQTGATSATPTPTPTSQPTNTPTTGPTNTPTPTTAPTNTPTTGPTNTPTPTPTTGGAQLLGNPGFETGSAAPWTATSGVINNGSAEPPHSGSWDAWLDGYGTTHTDTLAQTVTIPAATRATLSFWLHIDTAETTTTTAYDTLTLQILDSSGGVLATLHTWSNLDANSGYAQQNFDVSAYIGQTITVKFTGTEDYSNQTSFVIDDTALTTQ